MEIVGAVFPPYRLFLIPAGIFVLWSLVNKKFHLMWIDFLMIAGTIWIGISLSFTSFDAAEASVSTLAVATDTALAYFFARAALSCTRRLRIFLVIMAPGLVLSGVLMMIEAVTHQRIIQPAFAAVFGGNVPPAVDFRFGLLRARGQFPHPILAGIFMVSFLPLYLMAGLRGWPKIAGIVAGVVSVFTLSSAALLGVTLSTSLILYNWLSERIENLSWRLFFIVATMFVLAAEVGTKSGSFNLLVRYASLNSDSAYNRVLIWRFGTESVAQNPWFGIGFNDWVRPVWMKSSVDHYWLLHAMQFGLVPPTLLAIATIAAVIMMIRKSTTSYGAEQTLERGLAIALAVFGLGIVSVSIWLSAQVWFYMMLGTVVGIASSGPKATRQYRAR